MRRCFFLLLDFFVSFGLFAISLNQPLIWYVYHREETETVSWDGAKAKEVVIGLIDEPTKTDYVLGTFKNTGQAEIVIPKTIPFGRSYYLYIKSPDGTEFARTKERVSVSVNCFDLVGEIISRLEALYPNYFPVGSGKTPERGKNTMKKTYGNGSWIEYSYSAITVFHGGVRERLGGLMGFYRQLTGKPVFLDLPDGNWSDKDSGYIAYKNVGATIDRYCGTDARVGPECNDLSERFMSNAYGVFPRSVPGETFADMNAETTSQTPLFFKFMISFWIGHSGSAAYPPMNGSIISFPGHVAVVKRTVAVSQDAVDCYLFEQNVYSAKKAAFSRKIRFTKKDGVWTNAGGSGATWISPVLE